MDNHFILSSTIFLCAIQYFIASSTGVGIDDLSQNSKRREKSNLTCYVCHSELHSECLEIDQIESAHEQFAQICSINETFCMVKQIYFSTTGSGPNATIPKRTVAIKRNCTQRCDPGCVIMGERTRLYVCSTCCTGPLCNVGSRASRSRASLYPPLFHIPSSLYNLLVSILLRSILTVSG